MKEIVAEIFAGMDQKLISEELKAKVAEMINQIVEARTAAKTAEITEKAKKIEEANVALQKEITEVKKDFAEKETYLHEAANELGKQLSAEFKEKEQILFETINEYQQVTVDVFKETAKEYRDLLEGETLGVAGEYKTFLEQQALEAAAEFKKSHETARATELTKFKEDLLEKADEYIVSELKKNIPANIMEAAAEAAALKPLVEGVIAVIESNGVKIDKTGVESLKVAKDANNKLSESLNNKISENVKLESRVKALEKQVKLSKLTEGMTLTQRTKAEKLLESSSVENLEQNFKAIKDMIIQESTKSVSKTQTQKVDIEATKAKVEKIVESITKPATKSDEMSMWAADLDRMRRN